MRQDALVNEFAPGHASRLLAATERAELLLVAHGEPTRFVERSAHLRSGEERPCVVAQLLIYDQLDGQRVVRDIKEQNVWFGDPELLTSTPRLVAFWQGLGRALTQVLSRQPLEMDAAMPTDLIPTRLLDRQSFRTAEQFEKAALGKSYLGRLLRDRKSR